MRQRSRGNGILPGTCTIFTHFDVHLCTACTVILVSPGLPLKIREQLSPEYLIPSPRILWTELSRGGCGEEEWTWEPFWVFVNVYFKMCLNPGSGLADMNLSVCVNVPMSEHSAQFKLLMEKFSRVLGSVQGQNID